MKIFHTVMRRSSEKYDLEGIIVNKRNVVFQTWFWPAIFTWIFWCWWMEWVAVHLIHHTVTGVVMKTMLSPCINHITCCISYLRVGIQDTSYGNIFSRISRAWTQNIKQEIRFSRFDNIHNSSFTNIFFSMLSRCQLKGSVIHIHILSNFEFLCKQQSTIIRMCLTRFQQYYLETPHYDNDALHTLKCFHMQTSFTPLPLLLPAYPRHIQNALHTKYELLWH